MNKNQFPICKSSDFNERDNILQSLIERTILKKFSAAYLLSTIEHLHNYNEKNGDDTMIDILFMKYLKKCREIIPYIELISKYHIAVAVKNNNTMIINKINSQLNETINGNGIDINGIKISNYFLNLILNYLIKNSSEINFKTKYSNSINSFSKYSINNIFNLMQNKQKIAFYAFKNNWPPVMEMKNVYNEFNKDVYQYFSLDFWSIIAAYELITDFTINAGDNPYLLNAGACLSYKCRRIKVNYDISKIKLPKQINNDLIYLIRYKLNLDHLLEYQTNYIEIKNLCSLVYLLYVNETPIDSLCNYLKSIEPIDFIVLFLVYSNYVNNEIPDSIFKAVLSCFNSNKIKNEILLFKYVISMIKSKVHLYSYIPNDYLYIVPKSVFINYNKFKIEYNAPSFAFAKRALLYGKIIMPAEIAKKNEGFLSFIDDITDKLDNKTRKMILFKYKFDLSNDSNVAAMISYCIDEHEYFSVIDLLSKITPNPNLIKIIKGNSLISKIKLFLKNIDELDCSYEILDKFELLSVLDLKDKYEICFKGKFNETRLNISRDCILRDSINEFSKYDMENKKINVHYKKELGTDAGGLTRDWFSSVSKAIKDTGIFTTTPNGDKLTFNITEKDNEIAFFTGQLIGVTLSNMQNIDLKLTSFIWKKLLNHQISIDDMKDYDIDMYNSLKWISENDVTECSLTFVNSNDDEMIENGKNIDVNNDNKKDYINLIIEDKLIKQFSTEIENISSGFRSVIGKRKIDLLYSSYELYKSINGEEKIDIEDWKRNTNYNNKNSYDMFFKVISNWPMIKQQKLLKFVTGSSQVPIDGFKELKNRGGLFKLNFINYEKNRLPSSHTCSNHLDIPLYKTHEEFDKALSYAIECDDFGFY